MLTQYREERGFGRPAVKRGVPYIIFIVASTLRIQFCAPDNPPFSLSFIAFSPLRSLTEPQESARITLNGDAA